MQENEVFDFTYNLGNEYDKVVEYDGVKNYIVYGNTFKIDKHNLQPDEFLWMLLNCRNFYSTSYHGLIFSILFNKHCSFTTIKGKCHGNARIDNVVKMLNVKFENGKVMNYGEVMHNIELQREKSKKWL